MKSFEEICREYEVTESRAESDCFFLLKCKSVKNAKPDIRDREYLIALLTILHSDGFIVRGSGDDYTLGLRSNRALKREWVYRNIKKEKRERCLKLTYYILTIAFAAVAAIASVFGVIIALLR